MERHIFKELVEWKESPRRKPLMLLGARQVGKTYILRELGRREFDNMVYVNCYKNEAVATLFSQDADVRRILLGLSALTGEEIWPQRTLVFLDEVQEIPEVVSALKYFCEDAPEIAVAVAGSLLGVRNMEGHPFPTGKVDIYHLYPMTYVEFLNALGKQQMASLLDDPAQEELVNTLLPKYQEYLRQYYFVGGMPEAVREFADGAGPQAIRKIQEAILTAYDADIGKHAGRDTQKARLVFESIPAQLAKENKKFIFGALRKGARAADYENAIQWLLDAGLVYKVCRLTKAAIPIKNYMEKDSFKLFLLDVGLLGAMAGSPADMVLIGDRVFSEYKGSFTENYVLTQMVPVPNLYIGYYSKENSTLEIDFVVQAGAHLLPVEVKAEENVKSRSLRQFVTIDNAGSAMTGYRFSMKGFVAQDWMRNVPLCAVYPYLSRLAE